MIDWLSVALNAIWILGLAILVAAVGYLSWRAADRGQSVRHCVDRTFHISFTAGICLFCLGMAAVGRSWWERVVWGFLAAAFVWQDARPALMRASRVGEPKDGAS